jgi:Tol biopolymer transport system component
LRGESLGLVDHGGNTVKKCLVLVALVAAACSPPVAAPAVTSNEIPTAMALPTETELTVPAPPIEFPPPQLSPIGDQPIIFASNATGDDEIYVVNADGSNPVRITDNPERNDICPEWSPDGEKFAYFSYMQSEDGHFKDFLVIASVDGNLIAQIEPPETYESTACPSWSPDGNWISFHNISIGLMFVYRDGSRMTSVHTYWPNPVIWSPDSKSIAFADSDYGLRITDLNGSIRGVTSPIGWFEFAVKYFDWSPDGSKIAYVDGGLKSLDDITSMPEPHYIMLVNLDGSAPFQITPLDSEFDFLEPKWLNDHSILVVAEGNYDRTRQLYLVDLEEEQIRNLTNQDIRAYALSPRKLWIAYIIQNEIWVQNLMTNEKYLVSTLEESGSEFFNGDLLWFPDASHLLFNLDQTLTYVNLNNGQQTNVHIDGQLNGLDIR